METVGFTGTRNVTMDMLPRIRRVVVALPEGTRVITGGCVGVDAAVARVATQLGLPVHTVLPANRSRVDPGWQAHCDTYELMPAGTDYRARNERIVELSDRVIAFPEAGEYEPQSRRSGTWMTVRIARKAGKPVQEA